MCLKNPETCLWSTTRGLQEVQNIFHKIQQFKYGDRPDYDYIKEQLNTLLKKEEASVFYLKESLTVIEFIIT